jgi:hypothetical protein
MSGKSIRTIFFCALFIALMLAFRLIGCSQSSDTPSPTTSTVTSTTSNPIVSTTVAVFKGYREYYPNTDGYSWTYTRNFSDGRSQTEKITYAGTTTAFLQTVQIARRETHAPGSVSTSESLFKVSALAVYVVKNMSGTDVLAAAFVFPLFVGSDSGASTVLALEDVTVPAGSFINCFKLRSTDGGYTYYSWLAPNVGMVKAEKINSTSISTAELTSNNF